VNFKAGGRHKRRQKFGLPRPEAGQERREGFGLAPVGLLSASHLHQASRAILATYMSEEVWRPDDRKTRQGYRHPR
jgi:hypothetical protein